jgi:hypothetical protein
VTPIISEKIKLAIHAQEPRIPLTVAIWRRSKRSFFDLIGAVFLVMLIAERRQRPVNH